MDADIVFADECKNETCKEKFEELEKEIGEIEKQVCDLKAKYGQMLIENLKKDLILEELNEKSEVMRFDEFSGDFSKEDLHLIQSVSNSKQNDPLFVRVVLRSLYASNLTVLNKRCVSGKSKSGEKSEISPVKRQILDKIYNRRMEIASVSEVVESRRNTLNKHIKAAIEIITKNIK